MLPDLLTRVEGGEEVTITRHGRAVAVLVRPDALRSRSQEVLRDAERIHDLLVAAAAEAVPARWRAHRGAGRGAYRCGS